MSKKKKKIRTAFRKNRQVRTRHRDLTQQVEQERFHEDDEFREERITGKGELVRKRTVVGEPVEAQETGFEILPDVDLSVCRPGRVLQVQGLISVVQAEDGTIYRCAVRRLLKTLSTKQRHVVTAGDRILFRPAGTEGIIERIEPRRRVLSRTSRRRRHILVANVDQMLILASAAEPDLKPHLIDRFLVTAEKSEIRPLICINKMDLVDGAELQPMVGVYAQMGYQVLQVSAKTGMNVGQVRDALSGQETVICGQSGVGKSSLLNAVQPGLNLRTATVSPDTEKGRHTTTTAVLLPLPFGGYVVDTPGIRQFQLWDVIPEEVAGYFRDIRPYVSFCRFPNCSHTHESECAVKHAVADGRLDMRRYDSYCHMVLGDQVRI
ncbi:MAG: ribosome small subunit-dependent GTPase A [Planctomycetales bacterium]|nr:ribosome small subunit-dependent GTPase A [Planctomycetales bacterium]NIM10300.1 ribosome small subunit-dependent GTPase A [Planctomycetales bacterium]NIN09739.1 ribosome small subunit-dependent GTPase A [Planctomycetales bacterium]NIN78864.1 ribosome small subunit-dependent GTPase A [Planctomycetales bacterium]NIO36031.1 ribosome small subunit-dependent GTPase A [Planctomycetales bacterium]